MQLKLNKNVGKNCYPDAGDVMIVQTCLANIKVRTKFGLKPLWQGKIDGKNSRDLVCAIETFEASEGLRVTGKVEAYGGQTFAKLKQQTPTQVLNKMTSGGDVAAINSNTELQKIKQAAVAEARRMTKNTPLPEAEALALGKFIENAGTMGIAITVRDIKPSSDGRAIVDIEALGLTSGTGQQGLRIGNTLHTLASTNARWSFDKQAFLLKTTQWSSPLLKSPVQPSAPFLKVAGVQGHRFNFTISSAYLGGLERYILKLQQSDTMDGRLEAETLALIAKESDQLKTKLVQSRKQKLDMALTGIEGMASRIAVEASSFEKVRSWYVKGVAKKISAIKEMANTGKIGFLDAELRAHSIRGEVMDDARKKATTFGKKIAKDLKAKNVNISDLQSKYLDKYFNGKQLNELSSKEREQLSKIIIEAAGRPNATVSAQAKIVGNIGRGFWLLTFAMAVYQIAEAENKLEETGRQTSIIGGAIAGGAAGAKAGVAFGPWGIAAGALIGSIFAALGAEYLYDEVVSE